MTPTIPWHYRRPPCDPIHPSAGYYTVAVVIWVHQHGKGQRMAQPLAAYRDLETAMEWAEDEAISAGGFFTTLIVIDPFGRLVGRYSMTTMASNPNPGSSPGGMRRPQLISGVCDRAGIKLDELPELDDRYDEDQRRIVALVAEAEAAERECARQRQVA